MLVRRLALVVALAALAPGLARAAQGASPSAGSRVAVLVGVEDEDGPAALQLRGDLEFTQQRLTPAVTLSLVGSLGYSRFHDEATVADPFFGPVLHQEATTHVLRFAPAARFSFGSHPVFRPYVDGSLGLYWASWSFEETDYTFAPPATFTASDSEVSVFMRFAAGAQFQLSPALALGAEIGFMPYFGDFDATTTSLLASATFRM